MCYTGRCKYEIKDNDMYKGGCGVLCGQEIPKDALCKYEDVSKYIGKNKEYFNVEKFKQFLIEISNKGDIK